MVMKGLKFRRLDLHIHTPASKCFKNKTIKPNDIIKKSLEMKLDAIAITDHNSAEWIDIVKEKANNALVVFPGVEITTWEGLHIVALFDVDKSRSDVENFLGAIDITSDKYGATDALSKLNAEQVIEKIVERNGLAILAHIDSPKGAFKELDGISRLNLFNESMYVAVECEGKCLPSDLKNEKGFKRIPAFYLASDNPDPEDNKKHSIEGIGSKFSYFKMDIIDLEGLRQCFADSSVRIMLADEVPKYNYPQIVSLSISDGFLKDQHLEFMPGLNCIIGGKGTGKSLAVEFLRFALDQASCDAKILEDHSSKLDKQLGQSHKIMAAFQLENGALYEVTKSYEGSEGGKILCNSECKNVTTGEDYQGDIATLFPILAYSQLEVIKISEREEAQLELIDKFIETTAFDDRIKDLSTKLSINDEKLSESILAKAQVAELNVGISTLSTQIAIIDDLLKNPTFVELKKLEKKDVALNGYLSYTNSVRTHIEKTKGNLSKLILEEVNTEFAEDKEISGAAEIATKVKDITIERLDAIISEISSLSSSIAESISICQGKLKEKREEHARLLLEKGIDENIEKNRVSLIGRMEKLEAEKKQYQSKVDEFNSLFSERQAWLPTPTQNHW